MVPWTPRYKWFPKIGGFDPQNGWFIMVQNLIKMDDLGVALFLETPKWHTLYSIFYDLYMIIDK